VERPKPKADLAIFRTPMAPYNLTIAAVTADAQGWINREAPIFGGLQWLENIPFTGALFVSPAFDPSEVQIYLMSFIEGDDEETDPQV